MITDSLIYLQFKHLTLRQSSLLHCFSGSIPTHLKLLQAPSRKNEFLGDILNRNGVDWSSIDQVTRNHKDVFDVRKIRTGGSYTMFLTLDTIQKLKYFAYEHDLTHYYLFSFNDTPSITAGVTETFTRIGFASGTIETSLWESVVKSGLNPTDRN